MLWMRETAGGIFDTPERRAELERRLRDTAGHIRDESLRFHYNQEMRDRVHAFFGAGRGRPQKGRDGRAPGQGGQFGRPGITGGRLAVSESLARSALLGRGGAMPLREAAIVVALINHPVLIDENFEHVEMLGLSHPDLEELLGAAIDAMAHGVPSDGPALLAAVAERHRERWERATSLVRKARIWPVLDGAAIEDVREAFAQALHLHRSAGTLHKELKAAEMALADDPTDENYRHLVEIQAQFRDAQATEALIEGFGIPSGRGGHGF